MTTTSRYKFVNYVLLSFFPFLFFSVVVSFKMDSLSSSLMHSDNLQTVLTPSEHSMQWDWVSCHELGRVIGTGSLKGIAAYLSGMLQSSPPVLSYGLLDSLLCIIGRYGFEIDFSSFGDQPAVPNLYHAADAAYTVIRILNSLISVAQVDLAKYTVKEKNVLDMLVEHKWCIHDVVQLALHDSPYVTLDGDADLCTLLLQIMAHSKIGADAVVREIEWYCMAAQVYTDTEPLPLKQSRDRRICVICEMLSIPLPAENLRAGDGDEFGHFKLDVRRMTRAVSCAWQTFPFDTWSEQVTVRNATSRAQANKELSSLRKKLLNPFITHDAKVKCNRDMSLIVLDIGPTFLDAMVTQGVFRESKAFSTIACSMDKSLVETDEFQAGRNAWACFGLQLVI